MEQRNVEESSGLPTGQVEGEGESPERQRQREIDGVSS